MIELKVILPHEYEIYADRAAQLEKTYPEELRADRDCILEMFRRRGAIALAAEEQLVTAAVIIGYPLDADELETYHIDGICRQDDTSIYLETITVDESFRNRGLGLLIIKEFAHAAYRAGFSSIIGHFRKNGSFTLMKKIGGREIKEEVNWFGTGESFVYCEAQLPIAD